MNESDINVCFLRKIMVELIAQNCEVFNVHTAKDVMSEAEILVQYLLNGPTKEEAR
jgi:hypothetical protein